MQVALLGSGFGAAQGGGIVWLGSANGTVVSWSDTQIVAALAANATSGTVRVWQNSMWSNSVSITVSTASMSGISPTSGVAGTLVQIAGSGFGASQGNGQVWLGTANGVVQSWSDTLVVAAVADGSASGQAQVLQGGVWSNAVTFTVNTPRITSVDPASAVPGVVVTLTGSGFGAAQGSGAVWLGSAAGQVVTWSDTQVTAAVAAGAVSGVARVQQGGTWSNALAFTVPGGGTTVTLAPNLVNLVVRETRTIQATGAGGQALSGLAWTTSDAAIVSLSTDDPPVLTAVAAGHATVKAGTASVDVTVWAGTPPLGTVIWSNAGNGSGATKIVPAVPSATGVAHVFAVQGDGTVQAISSEGKTAWTADLSNAAAMLPDFQGGLVTAAPV